ncbi:MAG: flippase-like domain-containing protein [Halobacteriales archaeon]|nr:flippase-like domain-containing protein [Halobacteriales archaeon]
MSGSVEVSVVLPAYDEAATLERTVEVTLETLDAFLPSGGFEVIVAEDGCTDATPEVAARLAEADDRVRHLHADERLGRGGALRRAFRLADGEVLAYLDTDLATDMGHLEELIGSVRSGEYDVATGSRWLPGHVADRPAKRGVPSYGYNWLVRHALGSALRDHQCGFKAVDRAVLDDLLDDVRDDHWFFDTELLVRAQRAGYRVREFPVEWTPQGDTKVDLVRDVLGMGSQVVRTWWELSVRPRVTRRRSAAAGILLTAAAIALMGLYLPFGAVLDRMGRADAGLVALAAVVYLASWPVRGLRYRDILAELGHRERVGFLTGAVFVSQTGNLVFPARAGDAVRAYVVKARRAIPYPTGFASLAIERVFDLLTITALAGVTLLGLAATGSLPALTGGPAADPIVRSGRTAILVAGVVGALAVLAVAVIVVTARSERNRVRSLVARLSEDSYANDVAAVLERFVGDVQTVASDPAAFRRVGATSVAIWVIDVLTAAAVFAAFGTELAPAALLAVCFFAVSVGNLAKVLPLSPGGIGLYEGAFTLLVIGVTGIGWEVALGVAIVDHAVKNAVTLVGGVASMLWLNVSLTTAVEEAGDSPPAEAD